jgi:hypothetical protein
MIFDIVQKKLGNCAEKKDKSDFIFNREKSKRYSDIESGDNFTVNKVT